MKYFLGSTLDDDQKFFLEESSSKLIGNHMYRLKIAAGTKSTKTDSVYEVLIYIFLFKSNRMSICLSVFQEHRKPGTKSTKTDSVYEVFIYISLNKSNRMYVYVHKLSRLGS